MKTFAFNYGLLWVLARIVNYDKKDASKNRFDIERVYDTFMRREAVEDKDYTLDALEYHIEMILPSTRIRVEAWNMNDPTCECEVRELELKDFDYLTVCNMAHDRGWYMADVEYEVVQAEPAKIDENDTWRSWMDSPEAFTNIAPIAF